jgi:hypothetical protein
MKIKILLLIISAVLMTGCGEAVNQLNKRAPDEFMVKSNHSLRYPEKYVLVSPVEANIQKEMHPPYQGEENGFLSNFNSEKVVQ